MLAALGLLLGLVGAVVTTGPATAASGDPTVGWSEVGLAVVGSAITEVDVGANGTIAVAGSHGGWPASLAGTALPVATDGGEYVALLDADGDVLWAWSTAGDWDEHVVDVEVDHAGGVWVALAARGTTAGFFDGKGGTTDPSVTFPDDGLSQDVVLARFNANGTSDWIRKGGWLGDDVPVDVALVPGDGAYLVGNMAGEEGYHVDFGAVRIDEVAGTDAFLVRYSQAGTPTWGISIGGSGREEASAVAVTPSGDPVLAGWVFGTPDIFATEPEQLPGTMVVRVDATSHDLEWVRRYASDPGSAQGPFGARPWAYDIEADPDGSLWLAGYFNIDMVLGPFRAAARNGGSDSWVAHLGATGLPIGLATFGTGGEDFALELDLTAEGRPVALGLGTGTFQLPGGSTFTGVYGAESYAVWLTRSLTVGSGIAIGTTGTDQFYDGAVHPGGGVVAAGRFDTRTIDVGSTTHTLPEDHYEGQGLLVQLIDPVLPRFGDVPLSHPFYADIEWLAASGAATGYDDGTYRPGAAITRQAMAAFLWRQAGEPAVPPGAPMFPDVPPGHPFATAIGWMAGTGLATGYDDGLFRPGNKISRQAMAAFLWRLAAEPPVPDDAPTFTDVGPDHRFGSPIGWMADAGITEGYPDGRFQPVSPVTRQAMAAFLHRFDDCCASA